MKKILLLIPILFIGCVNKKGISLYYYDNCKEYYDLMGVYHKECPDNIINFKKKQKMPFIGLEKKECLQCN
jgi:hypothetical protein